MNKGIVTRMYDAYYLTPNKGVVMDLNTGIEYEFIRPDVTSGRVLKWNVETGDAVSFIIVGGKATEVTLLRKHKEGIIFS